MTQPLVSICIPAYARPAFLREALVSVIEQRFGDFELIVGDDSGDLEPIVEGVKDERIRYFRNDQRYGMAGNWGLCLDRARGHYVGLLMDDDRLMPAYLERVMASFQADPSLGVVFTNHFFDEQGAPLRERNCALAGGRYPSFLRAFLEHQPVAVSAALMRKDVWNSVRPLPDLTSADFVLFIRAALAGYCFQYLDEPLMIYRLHPGQLTQSEIRFRKDIVSLWEMMHFDDAECESLRRTYLSRSLVVQAASDIKRGHLADAAAAAARSSRVGGRGLTLRERLVTVIARYRALARISQLAWTLWLGRRIGVGVRRKPVGQLRG